MKSTKLPLWIAGGWWLVAALVMLSSGIAQAQEIEGTWRLVMRKFQDGTTQTPPAIQGVETWHNGLGSVIVDGHTPEGKLWSFSVILNYKLSATEWTETVLLSVFDHGDGKLPDYDVTGASKTSPVTHEGPRISFKPPFAPVSYAFEGDKQTATLEGVFVDYFERVR
jgi:hypothetical protein